MSAKTPTEWIRQTIEMAVQNVRFRHGGPFAALVIKEGEIVGSGVNSVTATNDPTAHAEMLAIRSACQNLGTFQLSGCELYTNSEPCPMCLGAIYWARLDRYYFGCTCADAAAAGFDDVLIYCELPKSREQANIPGIALARDEALRAFAEWEQSPEKVRY